MYAPALSLCDYKDKQKFIETPNFGRKLFCRTPSTVSKKSLPLRELNDDLSVEYI